MQILAISYTHSRSYMAEQSQSQSQSHPQYQLQTNFQSKVSQPTLNSETTTTITTDRSLKPSTFSKIPFRPRKIRKVSDEKKITTLPESVKVLPLKIIRPLSSKGEIDLAIQHLCKSDPLLAALIDVHQPPTFDSSRPPFLALARSILYQQLAYKAATSIYTRFVSLCGGEAAILPNTVVALSPQQLRQIGVSGRKASYLHDLASKYINGILSDSSVVELDDKSLYTMLTMVKGIGSWSVDMFMIFSLHRPDVLPLGDLGVRKGVQLLYGLKELPKPSQMEQLCEKWKPYRSVGAWYMWRFVESKGAPAACTSSTLIGGAVVEQKQQQQA